MSKMTTTDIEITTNGHPVAKEPNSTSPEKVESRQHVETEIPENLGAWLLALGAFFVYTATWYVHCLKLFG